MSGCPYSLLTWMTKLVWNKPLDWRLFTSSDTLLDFFTHELTWMWFSHGWPHGQNEIDSTHYQLPHFLVSFIPLLISFFFFNIYTWQFLIHWWASHVASQGKLGSDILDTAIWFNPNGLHITLFHSSRTLPCGAS